ncbi:MAG: hypothetical protein II208_00495 [Alphaproteobacteria bacterium]|nr:hypothetical protein [Alphaproteobacteria bacterium]
MASNRTLWTMGTLLIPSAVVENGRRTNFVARGLKTLSGSGTLPTAHTNIAAKDGG